MINTSQAMIIRTECPVNNNSKPLNPNFFHLRLLLANACLNTPYLDFHVSSDSKTEPKCTFSFNKPTCDLNYAHSLTSMQWSGFLVGKYLLRAQAAFPARNEPPIGKGSIFSPVHAARAGISPLGANHGCFTSRHSSFHVHVHSTLIYKSLVKCIFLATGLLHTAHPVCPQHF